MYSFLEFFAGAGLARAGLGKQWQCLLANDIDPRKSSAYRANWGDDEFVQGDIAKLDPALVSKRANLAWASFPCQDVSQAGAGAGIKGHNSGTFWPFWRFILALEARSLSPDLIVLENVCGMITSHQGRDFDSICSAVNGANYRLGALVINASLFVPQSRPRVFVVAVRKDIDIPAKLTASTPKYFHNEKIQSFVAERLTMDERDWIWWNPVPPNADVLPLSAMLESDPADVPWHTHDQTCAILRMMSPHTLKKVSQIRRRKDLTVGTVYRRMRPSRHGGKVQRAEVRFDGISGCLRAPTGGSSRQVLLFVQGNNIRSRLLSSREAARLMGLSESYKLPNNYYEAYRISGEGVAVPVVSYLAQTVLRPILDS
jgi:DNA (cytosine-5)-methyltransferase 1